MSDLRFSCGKIGWAALVLCATAIVAPGQTFISLVSLDGANGNAPYPLITVTVPAGATTGSVQVTKPVGTVSSNVPFRVRQ